MSSGFHNLFLLFSLRRKQFKNGFNLLIRTGRLRLATIAFTLVLVWLALFGGFYRSFIFLGGFLGLGDILIDRLIFLLSLALFMMLIFSNTVISFQLHYQARETAYLLTLPLPHSTTFWFLLLETVVLSTWASLFLAFPVALAYGITHNFSLYNYLSFPIFGFCLGGLAALLGILLSALLIRILALPRFKATIVVVLLLSLLIFILRPAIVRVEPASPDQQLYLVNRLLRHTRITLNPLLPSFWATEGFLQWIKGNPRRALGFLSILLVNLLFLSQIVDATAGNLYHRTWSLYQSRRERARKRRTLHRTRRGKNLIFPFSSPFRALLLKDLKVFIRDPAQWIQGVILFGLLAIYIINIKNMPAGIYQPFWKNLITFFNLGASSLILATLTTRFVYPALSLEGKTFWILGLAPLPRPEVLLVKFWGALAAAICITLPLIYLSNQILEVPGLLMVITCSAIVVMSLALVSLAVGLGALFPDFKQTNPARIASGFGGTLNLIVSLTYIVLVVGALAVSFHFYQTGIFPRLIYWAVGLTIVLSLIGTYLPLKLGINTFRHQEF